MRRSTSRSRSRCGFTLIELLVVIAIIAILAAILFPVFAQARAKARQTQCMSNLKQIALGALMYMQDYDETFPTGLILGVPGPACQATANPWQCMYSRVPASSRFGSGNCTGASPPFTCSFFFFRDFNNVFRPSVAEQIWSYVKNHRVFYDPEDPNGDRFASGRWTGAVMAASYMWVAGPSFGNVDCRPGPTPFTLAAIAAPANMQMVQDNWVNMHTQGVNPQRWIVAFADGHVKFALWTDGGMRCRFRGGVIGGPWAWNHCNPQDPQEINQPLPNRPPYCN